MIRPSRLDGRLPGRLFADLPAIARRLDQQWADFHAEGRVGDLVRPLIAGSWARSAAHEVPPERPRADPAGAGGRRWARRMLTEAALPAARELADEVAGSDTAVVVCDEQGRMLARRGDRAILRASEAQNFVPDALWSERGIGTNGIGLALSAGRPAQVFAAEHFCASLRPYACTAAPIRHPLTREVLGVLDMTTRADELTHHAFPLVVRVAREVERELEAGLGPRERELLERLVRAPDRRGPLLAVDAAGRPLARSGAIAREDAEILLARARTALLAGEDREEPAELSRGPAIVACCLVRAGAEAIGALAAARSRPARPRPAPVRLRELEREAIDRALLETAGNVSRAAALLGISRSTLHRRLAAYRAGRGRGGRRPA